jgi:hypothetical protein
MPTSKSSVSLSLGVIVDIMFCRCEVMTQFLRSKLNEAHLLQINNSFLAENTARTQNE